MMRTASCFLSLFLLTNQLRFRQEASKSIPLLVQQRLPNLCIGYSTLHTNAYQMIYSMAPNIDPKWYETRPIQPITASFCEPPLLQIIILGPRKNHLLSIQCTNSDHSPFSHFLSQAPHYAKSNGSDLVETMLK